MEHFELSTNKELDTELWEGYKAIRKFYLLFNEYRVKTGIPTDHVWDALSAQYARELRNEEA